jgi:hypothetical protein
MIVAEPPLGNVTPVASPAATLTPSAPSPYVPKEAVAPEATGPLPTNKSPSNPARNHIANQVKVARSCGDLGALHEQIDGASLGQSWESRLIAWFRVVEEVGLKSLRIFSSLDIHANGS